MCIVNNFLFFTTFCVFLLSNLFFLLASTEDSCPCPTFGDQTPCVKKCDEICEISSYCEFCDNPSKRDQYTIESVTPKTLKVMVQIGTNATGHPCVSLERAKVVFDEVNDIYKDSKIQFQPQFMFLGSDISKILTDICSTFKGDFNSISGYNYGCHDDVCDFINVYWLPFQGAGGQGTKPWEEPPPTIISQDIKINLNQKVPLLGGQITAHELGHILGLWHVNEPHSKTTCDNLFGCCGNVSAPPSDNTDDFCSDTDPTPALQGRELNNCKWPIEEQDCYGNPFPDNSPGDILNNLMLSLAPDASGCSNFSLTPMQKARMHCYLDKVWREERKSSILSPLCGDNCTEKCCTSEGMTVFPATCCGAGTKCCSAIINELVPLNYSEIPTVKCCNEAEVCSVVPAADHNNSYPVCCPEGETPVFQPRFDFTCDSGGSTVEPLFFLALFVLLFTIFQ